MRVDWVPLSASSLVVGAAALSVGAVLVPGSVSPWTALSVAEQEPQRWLAVAVLSLFASVCLLLGMPAVLTLLDGAGRRVGLIGALVFASGCAATATYAVVLSVEPDRLSGAIPPGGLKALTSDPEFSLVLTGWGLGFALGELLLALAVLGNRRVESWVPTALVGHVLLLPFLQVLPAPLAIAASMLLTLALAGLGIAANQSRVPRAALEPHLSAPTAQVRLATVEV